MGRTVREPSISKPRIEPVEASYPADVQADFDKLMRGAPQLLLFRAIAGRYRKFKPKRSSQRHDAEGLARGLRQLCLVPLTSESPAVASPSDRLVPVSASS
jgi:hypothetical protein